MIDLLGKLSFHINMKRFIKIEIFISLIECSMERADNTPAGFGKNESWSKKFWKDTKNYWS